MLGERTPVKAEPRFDFDYAVGRQAELWVGNLREALKTGSAEVKRDRLAQKTGNVYVEYKCKRQGQYKPSGIAVTTAQFWVFQLDEDVCIAIATERLKRLAIAAKRDAKNIKEEKDGSHPTIGVVVKVRDLVGVS